MNTEGFFAFSFQHRASIMNGLIIFNSKVMFGFGNHTARSEQSSKKEFDEYNMITRLILHSLLLTFLGSLLFVALLNFLPTILPAFSHIFIQKKNQSKIE